MERSLMKLAERFQYEAAPPKVLQALEMAMREETSHPASKSVLDSIDENTIETEEDFNVLLEKVNEFTLTSQSNDNEIGYNYAPPQEVTLEEFGTGKRNEMGKFFFYEKGIRIEKVESGDGEFVTIGPVDEDNSPLKGHPDFIKPSKIERITEVQMLPNTADISSSSLIDLAQSQKEEEYESELKELQGLYDEEYQITEQVEEIEQSATYRKIEVVRAHLPNIGMFEYDVIGFVKNLHSITLVFDPRIAKPPFYPEPRLTFTLEYRGQGYSVVYLGICFDFEGLKYMCFNTGE